MASHSLTQSTEGHCLVNIVYDGHSYKEVRLSILPDLCSDVILGHDFLRQHSSVNIRFPGTAPTLSLGCLTAAKVVSPPLFDKLSADCHPIATKSRRHHPADDTFIQNQLELLLKSDIIEPSRSPWRAQVLVTTNERHKKRMVVDYSQTINKFTYLDAYPLPRIDELVSKISKYEFFSTLDLRSAYHQIPILDHERQYTAFEACGNLYQFTRIPFGVTNGVACFQRVVDTLLRENKVEGTFAYVDNVTVCGHSKNDHNVNLERFFEVAQRYGITFNDEKTVIASKQISLLGYCVSKGVIRPDPERLKPLRDLTYPKDMASQRRIVGMFSYYSAWIASFSEKIRPIIQNNQFPPPEAVRIRLDELKAELERSFLVTVDPNLKLTVETDASDVAIAATLNQEGRPVAFFSRTLNASERNHSSVEKEAYAIVESIRQWRHYLLGVHFQLLTDQRSVAFIYDRNHHGKIKNDKIQRWKLELSCFSYDVVYRPGRENAGADALSRLYSCSIASGTNLKELHANLCHPGVTRMMHFIRSKNLPHSLEEVKSVTSQCGICRSIKPNFHKPRNAPLIKATQPFERLSIDFKGPLPSRSANTYLLTVIDEFSRFPFAFPCRDMSASTVIACLTQLFSIFGMPSYIHSDRGAAFMSEELRSFLQQKGVACSRTTAYNPRCNGQVERLNGTLWQTVQLSLRSRGLSVNCWESVLTDALHAIRSLLCTATNVTPHERLFSHPRRSASGCSLPSWLLTPGTVLLKRLVRQSKYEPLVDEVELLECNPQYAHVRLPDGKETTVALRHLAPAGSNDVQNKSVVVEETAEPSTATDLPDAAPTEENHTNTSDCIDSQAPTNPSPQSTNQPFIRTRPYNLRSGEL